MPPPALHARGLARGVRHGTLGMDAFRERATGALLGNQAFLRGNQNLVLFIRAFARRDGRFEFAAGTRRRPLGETAFRVAARKRSGVRPALAVLPRDRRVHCRPFRVKSLGSFLFEQRCGTRTFVRCSARKCLESQRLRDRLCRGGFRPAARGLFGQRGCFQYTALARLFSQRLFIHHALTGEALRRTLRPLVCAREQAGSLLMLQTSLCRFIYCCGSPRAFLGSRAGERLESQIFRGCGRRRGFGAVASCMFGQGGCVEHGALARLFRQCMLTHREFARDLLRRTPRLLVRARERNGGLFLLQTCLYRFTCCRFGPRSFACGSRELLFDLFAFPRGSRELLFDLFAFPHGRQRSGGGGIARLFFARDVLFGVRARLQLRRQVGLDPRALFRGRDRVTFRHERRRGLFEDALFHLSAQG